MHARQVSAKQGGNKTTKSTTPRSVLGDTRYLVLDDLAFELTRYPIHVPIPPEIFVNKKMDQIEASLRRFTLKVYHDFMKLPYFTWYHDVRHIVIDGFHVRWDKVYPSIST